MLTGFEAFQIIVISSAISVFWIGVHLWLDHHHNPFKDGFRAPKPKLNRDTLHYVPFAHSKRK